MSRTPENKKIDGGYYIKARKIQDSEIAAASPCIREVWDWLIKEANHDDNERLGIKRGQLVRTLADIQEGLSWMIGYRKESYSKSQCENAMNWLKNRGMIDKTKTTRGLLITVCKYDYYQDPKNYEAGKNLAMKMLRNDSTPDTINKNVNNKEENIVSIETLQKQKEAYGFLVKDILTICKFIRDNKPVFPEPYADLWNLFSTSRLGGRKKVEVINDDRTKNIKTRVKEQQFDMEKILSKAKDSNFLINEWAGFDFDWIIESRKNYTKILNGRYDNNYSKEEIKQHHNESDYLKKRQEQEQKLNSKLGGGQSATA